jgi:hypothetical protein
MSNQGFNDNVIVYNLKYGMVYKWYITARWLMNGGDEPDLVIRASKQNVSVEMQDHYSRIADTELMRMARRGIDIPGTTGLKSAWDIARGTGNHHIFDEYVHDNYPITYWSTEFANVAGEFTFSFLKGIEIQLNFDDRTSIRVIMAPINTGDIVLKYVPGSAVYTKSDTGIPDRYNSLEGDYNFSNVDDLESFLNTLSEMGVEFRVISIGGYRGRVTIVPVMKR